MFIFLFFVFYFPMSLFLTCNCFLISKFKLNFKISSNNSNYLVSLTTILLCLTHYYINVSHLLLYLFRSKYFRKLFLFFHAIVITANVLNCCYQVNFMCRFSKLRITIQFIKILYFFKLFNVNISIIFLIYSIDLCYIPEVQHLLLLFSHNIMLTYMFHTNLCSW